MNEEKDLESGNSEENPEEDNTSIENEGLEEEETQDDSTDKDDKTKKKPSSEIYQKKKWRERAQTLEKELGELKTSLTDKYQKEGSNEDDAEKKAQKYIDDRIEKLLSKREQEKEKQTKEAEDKLSEEIEEILEDNEDITEKQILDLMEEFEKEGDIISPKQALRIIKREQTKTGKKKPNMPSPKRGSSSPQVEKKESQAPKGDFWAKTRELLDKVGKGEL